VRAEVVPVERVLPVRAAILRPGRPIDDARFDGDDVGAHWALLDGDDVVAVLSLMPHGHPAHPHHRTQLRGMAAARPGAGAGAALLTAVQRSEARPMWCNARLLAVPFYQRLGWVIVSDAFDIVGIGPHHRMTWEPQ
jgi:predicted GNAT family N-acyltransferase